VERTVLSLALIASLGAGAAFAADTATAPGQQPKKGGFDPNQIICKSVEETGSHLGGQRVCATWAEWDAQSQVDQKTMRDITMRPQPSPGGFSAAGPGSGSGMGR